MKQQAARRNAAFVRENVATDGVSSSQCGGHAWSEDEEELDEAEGEAGL